MLKFAFRSTVNALGAVFSIALLGLFAAAFALWYYAQGLPDYQKLANYEPPIVSRAYAADGRLIGEFASEKRIFMPYASIPKRVAMAFVSAEDQRYFSHPGIDLRAVARALRGNLVYGARLRGGSTITQQVAKNFFFTSERSYYRKIREMLLAFRIERAFDKEKILELYLNQIFLGRQAYGVAAAAQIYFSKALDELTVAEAAFLAALAQAPSRLNPERNARSAVSRRNYVIHRMLEDGHITAAEAEEAKAAPLAIKRPPAQVSVGAEYFVEEVRRDLLAKHGEATMQAGGFVIRSTLDPRLQLIADAALRRGLVAYDRRHGWRGPLTNVKDGKSGDWAMNWRKTLRAVTPPDGLGEWQMALVLEIDATGAEIGLTDGSRGRIPLSELAWARKQGKAAVEPGKPAFKTATGPPIRKAADVLQEGDVILVERIGADARNKPVPDGTYALRQIPDVTGALVAMDPHTGRILAMTGGFNFRMRQFNNTTQAWRQPGSSFKPYVYLTALQEGFTPSTVIADAPISVKDGDKLYQPHNYANKVYGPVPMRTAIELSLNLATLRLAEATGLARIAETATKLGVSDKLLPVMALALGAFETTPLRQVTAYSMIANGGLKITPTLVDRIQDRHGRTIYRHDARDCAACRAATFEGRPMPRLTDTRERIVDEDHAFQVTSFLQSAAKRSPAVANLGRPVAGKTGTTNDMMDAWFVGYTPDLVAAVWVGFDQPRSLGKDETGAMVASPVFADFMRAALKDVPKRDFVRPKGIVAVNLGGPVEYYKRGTEPGTGRGRELDAYDVADKSAGDPDVSPADRGYAYQRLDLPPPARRAPGFRAPDHHHPRYGYGMGHTY